VEIAVELLQPRKTIWLHGQGLKVGEATVTPENGEALAAEWEQVTEGGLAALRVAEELRAGAYTLRIVFDAPLDRKPHGLYRVDSGGESYAFTQLAPIEARRVFPCFDEPAFKAPFEVTLAVKKEHTAVASERAIRINEVEGGMQRIQFETTKALPTHVLGWTVGPFDAVEGLKVPANRVRRRPLKLAGYVPKGKKEHLVHALEATAHIVNALEGYLGVSYPHDKLDIVAAPVLAPRAMGNVGLVLAREHLMLGDPKRADEAQRRRFDQALAEALVGQWFGAVVTMQWWDDQYMNAALGAWLGNKVLSEIYPDYQAPASLRAAVNRAMDRDGLAAAPPLQRPVQTACEIREAYYSDDGIKAAGLLRMFEGWIGPDTFKRGIRNHLNDHWFDVATADRLLLALSHASRRDVKGAMFTFLAQPGVPFLEASLDCSGKSPLLTLQQSRFRPAGSRAPADLTWKVPVCIRYPVDDGMSRNCTLLDGKSGELRLAGRNCPAWVMANADGAGYYRFWSPPNILDALRDKGWNRLSSVERVAVADSIRAGFENGALPPAYAIPALAELMGDAYFEVARGALSILDFARDHLVDADGSAGVARFVRQQGAPVFKRLSWAESVDDSGDERLLRGALIRLLALSGDKKLNSRASWRGAKYVGLGGDGAIHPEVVSADLVQAALDVSVSGGNAKLYAALSAAYRNATDAALRRKLLLALGAAPNAELGGEALALVLDESTPVQDALALLRALLSNPDARPVAWEWLKSNLETLSKRAAGYPTARLPRLAEVFCEKEKVAEVRALFSPLVDKLPDGEQDLALAIETIETCAALVEQKRKPASDFFNR
jgi:alanyl aminopeptidase